MEITIVFNEGEKIVNVQETESDVWRAVGEILPDINIPNTVNIFCELGDARLSIIQRGTFIKDGIILPSMYVRPVYNNICLSSSHYEEAYLTCVNPESNNYKFYHLKPNATGINATYGRIGSKRGEMFGEKDLKTPYETYLYWIRYFEKLSKGYVDQTNIYLKKENTRKKVSKKEGTGEVIKKVPEFSRNLYNTLKSCARQYINSYCKSDNITYAQVKLSKKILKELGERKTVNGFNKKLLELMAVCPRKARYVNEYLATRKEDFKEIVEREENLVSAMEVLISEDDTMDYESFEGNNIEVYIANEKQHEQVMNLLGDDLKKQVKNIYRIINTHQKKRFNDYLEKNKIEKVKQFWHGSRNENWLSIIINGLQLNPNAIITGKMFGQGIYFASSSKKSFGYTSYHNSYWARGNSDVAFMGVYATAYGVPEDVYLSKSYTKSELDRKNKNCVHAHKGQALINDEIIFYDEDAVMLNYIVEFVA